MKISYTLFLLSLGAAIEENKIKLKGHLKPLGHQGTSLGEIPEIKFSPSGHYFYKHYLHQRRPVVIRNAVKHWLAVKNWSNETYLNETYGDLPFTITMAKKYNNSIHVRKDITLSEFLDIYKTEKVYLDSPFPPTNMLNEISLPSMLRCSEITDTISSVFLLMNSGDATSPLHHDGYENTLSVVAGSKRIILFDSSYSENVYADQFDVLPGLSPINVNSVDLEKFPKFADVKFYESTLNSGDMLYIPQFWWHFVYSDGTPNIGVNIWFAMFNFDEEYQKAKISEDKDVSKVAEMCDKLVPLEPSDIECKEQSPALDKVLNIVVSDTSAESLRIPKSPERPGDFKLASGYTMPPLGFGTAGLSQHDVLPAVLSALDAGYRLFDTAQIYGTEAVIAEAIKERKIPRSNITIVTKLDPKYHGYHITIASVEMSLKNLQTEYIDVFLIHTKHCGGVYFVCPEGKPEGVWQDSWRAMEHLHSQGKIRSLGVSNFDITDLSELLNISTVPVSVVQNWFDPLHQDTAVRQFCVQHGIHYMGYSTLGSQWTTYGGMDKNPVLTSVTFIDMASHHQFIVAQVILRWAIHLNVTVIPRSCDPRHIVHNFKSLEIKLTPNEIKTITEEYLPATSLEDEEGEAGGPDTREEVEQISEGLETKESDQNERRLETTEDVESIDISSETEDPNMANDKRDEL